MLFVFASESIVWVVVFFFQAEDGIRDDLVTGVQTCALPISNRARGAAELALAEPGGHPLRRGSPGAARPSHVICVWSSEVIPLLGSGADAGLRFVDQRAGTRPVRRGLIPSGQPLSRPGPRRHLPERRAG